MAMGLSKEISPTALNVADASFTGNPRQSPFASRNSRTTARTSRWPASTAAFMPRISSAEIFPARSARAARKAGFSEFVDTEEMILSQLNGYREAKVLP